MSVAKTDMPCLRAHAWKNPAPDLIISAFTASAREDGRLRPYVFDALWGGNRFSDQDMRKIS
jgi:hypothetical protein